MGLLVFSNRGNWDADNIGFRDTLSTEVLVNKGAIIAIQEFIRDDDVLDEYYVDEHKGLDVKLVSETTELQDLLNTFEMTLWTDTEKEPLYFVPVQTSTGFWIYVFYRF